MLDHDGRILLRADGLWETHGEVQDVCHAAMVPSPAHVWSDSRSTAEFHVGEFEIGSSSLGAPPDGAARRPPQFAKARGYVKLRTSPRGTSLRVLALIVLFLATAGLGGFIGVIPAVALPSGSARCGR